MPGFDSLGKILLLGAAVMAAAGIVLLILGRFGLGRLPGDIVIQKENFTFYFPLVTMILLSIVLTIILNIFRR